MKIAIFDYDNTLSSGYTRYELGYAMEDAGLVKKGLRQEILQLESDHENGKIDYNRKFADDKKIFSKYYKGLKAVEVARFFRDEIKWKEMIFPWAYELLDLLKSKDYFTVLISGSWEFILNEIQEELDIDTYFGTEIEVVEGLFTENYKFIMTNDEKRKVTRSLLREAERSIGLGDSIADLAILEQVNYPFIYQPSREAEEAVKGTNILIVNQSNVISEIQKVL